MPKSKRTQLENRLDELWRSVGKNQAVCEVCATLPPDKQVRYTQIHPHHIVGRNNRLLRWDLRNRCWLCPTHHTLGKVNAQENQNGWFRSEFTEKGDWLGMYRYEDKKYLEEMEKVTFKNWTIDELEQKVRELESFVSVDEYSNEIVRRMSKI